MSEEQVKRLASSIRRLNIKAENEFSIRDKLVSSLLLKQISDFEETAEKDEIEENNER